jgi:hypothetical protein
MLRIIILTHIPYQHGDGSVGSESLRAGRSGDRIPVGVRFSASVQTGVGAQVAFCTMGSRSFPGVKRLWRGVDTHQI